MNVFRARVWPPILVGVFIGVLSWFTFASAGKPIGITAAFEHTAASIVRSASPSAGSDNVYFRHPNKGAKLMIDWQSMFVLGVFVGGFISSRLAHDHRPLKVPSLWLTRFGFDVRKRYLVAFIAGMTMMLGARIAEGSTTGHGISGALQFGASSWIFVPAFFLVAIVTAKLVYGRYGDEFFDWLRR